jgi:hypothetical protein
MANVTRAEARALAEAVHRRAGFLWRLCSRMEKTGRTRDPLYRDVCAARDALHGLWVSLHYRGCGVTRPPAESGGSGAGAPA